MLVCMYGMDVEKERERERERERESHTHTHTHLGESTEVLDHQQVVQTLVQTGLKLLSAHL